MIMHQLKREEGILYLEPRDEIRSQDFDSVKSELDDFLREGGTLRGVLIDVPEFPGWKDMEALTSHLNFVKEHHGKVRRVAVLTEDSVLTSSAPALDVLVDADLKTFGPSDRNAAEEWLKNA